MFVLYPYFVSRLLVFCYPCTFNKCYAFLAAGACLHGRLPFTTEQLKFVLTGFLVDIGPDLCVWTLITLAVDEEPMTQEYLLKHQVNPFLDAWMTKGNFPFVKTWDTYPHVELDII